MYGIWTHTRVNKPSIVGNATFLQIMSATGGWYERNSGAITFQNHVNAWKNTGLTLGNFEGTNQQNQYITYQLLFTEYWSPQDENGGDPISGYYVNGSSSGEIN